MLDSIKTLICLPFVWVCVFGLLFFWGLPKLYILIERAFKRGG